MCGPSGVDGARRGGQTEASFERAGWASDCSYSYNILMLCQYTFINKVLDSHQIYRLVIVDHDL